MSFKFNKLEKIQKTVHFSKEIYQTLAERATINDRTFSAEVENIIKQYLKKQREVDMAAIGQVIPHTEQDQG